MIYFNYIYYFCFLFIIFNVGECRLNQVTNHNPLCILIIKFFSAALLGLMAFCELRVRDERGSISASASASACASTSLSVSIEAQIIYYILHIITLKFKLPGEQCRGCVLYIFETAIYFNSYLNNSLVYKKHMH